MKIEIELHEACAEDGETVCVRIVREWREFLDVGDQSVTLVRDHDRGTDLNPGADDGVYVDPSGKSYRVVRRLA